MAGRGRRSTPRCVRTWTAGSATGTSRSSAATARGGSPSPGAEALAVAEDFFAHRLAAFGPHEDAMLAADPTMAHSLLSAPLNLGLLDPLERDPPRGAAPTATAPRRWPRCEGFIRQLVGWRDYVWHIYWHLGPGLPRAATPWRPRAPLPAWLPGPGRRRGRRRAACARCWHGVRDGGWVHHIPRLMVLGNYALQRGWDPGAAHRLVPRLASSTATTG